MLATRLQRAQIELHSHRQWLKRFTAGYPGLNIRAEPHSRRAFTTTPSPRESHAQTRQHRPARGEKTWQKRGTRPANVGGSVSVQLDTLSAHKDLLAAVGAYDIKRAIASYAQFPERKPLTPDEVRDLTQCAHQCLRQERYKPEKIRSRENMDEIVRFAVQMTTDIKKGRLLPQTGAHTHLLGIFKESDARDAGIQFWEWLEAQEDPEQFVNLDVYAVAIDLLCVNGSSLQDLEDLYERALERFPGQFFAYHLSPQAILPDRSREMELKGLPMSLLQSICQARLMCGEPKMAYLALDTALRLFPTSVPKRMITAFISERPVSEFYTVFALSCRAGMQIPGNQFKELLARIRKSSSLAAPTGQLAGARAMLAAMYLQLGSSGALTPNSVSEVIIAITSILKTPGIGKLERKERKQIVDGVLKLVRQTMQVFAKYSILPTISAFNSIIINVAGYGRAKEVLGIVATDMKAIGMKPNDVTKRSLLAAAGLLKDPAFVKRYWKDLVDERTVASRAPDTVDFVVLFKAAKLAGNENFAGAEWERKKASVPNGSHSYVESQVKRSIEHLEGTQDAQPIEVSGVLETIKAVSKDLEVIDDRTQDRPVVQDFSTHSLPVRLFQPDEALDLSQADMEKLYDEFTTEQPLAQSASVRPTANLEDEDSAITQGGHNTGLSQLPDVLQEPAVDPNAPASPISITNQSYAQLRFEHWNDINYLLRLSEKHDQAYAKAVDEAIAGGKQPPSRNMGLMTSELESMKNFGLSETAKKTRGTADFAAAREEVVRLRSR